MSNCYMNFNFLDIVLYQKNPEFFAHEFPEKYQSIQLYLSVKENREQFFHYSNELDFNTIPTNARDKENFHKEFESFWTQFSENHLGKQMYKTQTRIPLFLPVMNLLSFFISIFLYIDHFFFAKYNLIRSLVLKEDTVISNSLFSFTNTETGYILFVCNLFYALLLLSGLIYFFSKKIFPKVLAVSLSLLFPTGIIFSAIWDIHTSHIFPELFSILYLLMYMVFLSVILKKSNSTEHAD
jgi:hypothetical protein